MTDVMMEVSSHSLDLHRVDGIAYDVAVFTNLTQDHLDYHKTMENYKIAKSMLFERSKQSVINIDDAAGDFMVEKSAGEVLTYAIDKAADLKAEDISITAEGTAFTVVYEGKRYGVKLHTPGRFSVYKGLGAIGACLCLGVEMEDILAGLAENPVWQVMFQTVRAKKAVRQWWTMPIHLMDWKMC